MKLAIAIPHTGTIKTQTVFSLSRAIKTLPFPSDILFKQGCYIHLSRIELVKIAIKRECTHILFIDSDMAFEKDAITQIVSRNKDIVGIHYNQRKLPLASTVLMEPEKKARIKEEHPDGFLTCIGVATGFMLINLEVFKKIKQPWFFFEMDDKGEMTTGEDYWFCKKAKEAGYEIWVDLTIPMKHIGDYEY